ncbi:hypothetical protein N7497_005298 [Penicillium chrysogenum]|nr:hypothetical protein N7497_005298 [Penicillium chrysogenum]
MSSDRTPKYRQEIQQFDRLMRLRKASDHIMTAGWLCDTPLHGANTSSLGTGPQPPRFSESDRRKSSCEC